MNPRSCVTCRKRKVKCDKVHPCNHCTRNHIECIFPGPGRAPRKVRKVVEGRDRELLDRLRRLEGVVKGMGVEVPKDGKEYVADPDSRSSVEPRTQTDATSSQLDLNGAVLPRNGSEIFDDIDHKDKTKWVEERQDRNFENRFGRLVVNEGKSRYINNSFWANLSNEVEDLKGILNQSSEDDEPTDTTPGTAQNTSAQSQGWVFGFSSQNVDLTPLHPPADQIHTYWETFRDRVDPLVKVLHVPTIEPTVLSAASQLNNLSKGFECLLFAIYYGATTSLSASDCLLKLGEEKNTLLVRYRFAVQQALARANFLTTEEIVVLQAFVVFLICLRRNNDARVIWTLTGLVVRIAQTIGVHRDGSHFNLPPFEVELRRRLWWQICILDTRASEDHGCDPTIIEQAFDTKMPLNINDVDITPDMKDFPAERQGCTDMSFCLIRFEVANTFRRINYIPPGPPNACLEYFANVTLEDKEKWITECHNRLEERYLKHCDMSVPLFWVTATVARLMMSKMWLMVYHPFQRHDGGASLPKETKEKLFITSLENIEYSLLLETESRTMKWGWLFKTYMQWHALAFILSELVERTTGDLVERAWIAVEKTRDGRWGMHSTENSPAGHLWRPLKKLYKRAKDKRAEGLREEAKQQQQPAKQPQPARQPQRTNSPKSGQASETTSRPTAVQVTSVNVPPQMARNTIKTSYERAPDQREILGPLKSVLGDASASTASPVDLPAQRSDQIMREAPRQQQQQQQRPQQTQHPQPQRAQVQRPSLPQQQQQPMQMQSMPPNGVHSGFAPYTGQVPAFVPSQQYVSQAQVQSGPQFGANYFVNTNMNSLGGTSNIDFSTLSPGSGPNASSIPSSHVANSSPHTAHPMHMNTFDSPNNNTDINNWDGREMDMSVMDTSGDLNWQSWDQLVKQYGMDVDGGSASGGQIGWASGSSWDVTPGGANMRMSMGMGMGGGDWF